MSSVRVSSVGVSSATASSSGVWRRDAVATACLSLFSVVSALVLVRAFDGWAFIIDVVVIVVAGHLGSFLLRRLGTPIWMALPLLAVALVCVLAIQHYGDTVAAIVPTGDTWSAFRLDASIVREEFPTATAPVDYAAGWAALAGIGVALVVLLGDTFAFRADARAESLVPGGVFFVFLSALGDGPGGIPLAAAVVGTGVLATAALRWYHDPHPPSGRRSVGRPRSLAMPAAVIVAVVVGATAGVVGPRLPGAAAPPLIETSGRSGGVTEVTSPLVDIRSRLVQQSDTEMFQVAATAESYWRVTTLPEFDGVTFRLPTRSLERTDGSLAAATTGSTLIRQDIQIRSLGGRLVPAAADPIEASGRDLRWNPDTSTLVTVGEDLRGGERFTVVSASPRVLPADLRSRAASVPPDAIHLGLPADFPASIAATAREIAAGTSTAYDAAIALQSWFRSEFDYSLEVQPGHGSSAIEEFLERRVGYCEQFAATFAAMARTLGIPSRVAVGYTAGLPLPDGTFSVLGRHAHAWPEVWFDGLGWIPFEPTPGRGAPGTEQYTGVAPQQDTTPLEPGAVPDTTPTTIPGTPQTPTTPGSEQAPAIPDRDQLGPGAADPSAGDDDRSAGESLAAAGRSWWSAVVFGGVAFALVLPWLVRRLRRRRLQHRPAAERVAAAWRQATAALRSAGVDGRASMTSNEWAEAAATAVPAAARSMRSLATAMDLVTFAPPGAVDVEYTGPYGSSMARDCTVWARQVEAVVDDRSDLRRRLLGHFARWH